MASDRAMFNAAKKKWLELYTERTFSVAPEMGYIAIMCSACTDDITEPGTPQSIAEIQLFLREALQFKELAKSHGRNARVFTDADEHAMAEVLADPEATDVVTIGHGSLAGFYVPNQRDGIFDWHDASTASTHLKTGFFMQRHCGGIERNLTVPLGTFTLADVRNVVAPVNESFEPQTLDDQENDKLTPVFANAHAGQLTYAGLKKRFKLQADSKESS